MDDLVDAMILEMKDRSNYLSSKQLETVYFGGGTPSLLSTDQLSHLICSLKEIYDLSSVKEFTLEANPEDLTSEKLAAYQALGVDRLSIGFQSLDNAVLDTLNRCHSVDDCNKSLTLAREAGFKKISVDLIYGIPGRDNEQWVEDLHKVIDLGAEHISCYALTIEEKTALYHKAMKGEFDIPQDDFIACQFEILLHELQKAGYEQYEVSNFCKPDYEAVHNSNYWKGKSYLGLGPGAHSFDGKSRQWNVENNHGYIKSLKTKGTYFKHEALSAVDMFNEYLLTSIRTKWGTDLKELSDIVDNIDYDKITLFQEQGLTFVDKDVLYLSDKGKLLADEITAQLILT